ncbi:hypothetical protein [Streptomyces sp. NBC_00503]|nr:hypothetical protein [Streptomyces sp. NBC_00503]WUD79170.1 hypothetical protein OG490_00415 [Streptomyces sp. NBC_00503]
MLIELIDFSAVAGTAGDGCLGLAMTGGLNTSACAGAAAQRRPCRT